MKPLLPQLLAMLTGVSVTVASTTIDPMVLFGAVMDAAAIACIAYTFFVMIKRREW